MGPVFVLAALAAQASSGAAPVCKDVGIPQADGSTVTQMMCRSADGAWRPAASAPEPAASVAASSSSVAPSPNGGLPARAEVTYQGTYDVHVSTPMKMPRRLDPGSILGAATQSSGRDLQGALTMHAVFDGPAVTVQASGTGGVHAARLRGSVEGGRCHLATDDGGTIYDGGCGPSGFSGVVSSPSGGRATVRGRFDLSATKVVDVAAREQQQKLAAAAAQAEREKQAAAAQAALAALPAAGPVLTKRLESYVEADSREWVINQYQSGSVHNVRVADGSARAGTMTLRGEFSYVGGTPGVVLAKFIGGKFDCIQFQDSLIGCRAVREKGYANQARGMIIAGTAGGSGGGSGRSCDSDCQFERDGIGQVQRDNEAAADAAREHQYDGE